MLNWLKASRIALLNISVLLAIFIISIFVRSHHFNQPLMRHHEWLTAHTLVTLDVWEKEGVFTHHGAPVYAYSNAGDKWDFSFCILVDRGGNAYYVSYGPFAFMLPYAYMKITGQSISPQTLVQFNLIVHFFIAFFLFLIVLKCAGKTIQQFHVPAIIVFAFYVFSPGTLWFHGNVYFGETLVQLFIAIGLYLFMRIVIDKDTSFKVLFFYGLVCFCMVYTEWLGVFFVFVTGLMLMIMAIRKKLSYKPFFIGASAGIIALLLILYQYSSILDFKALTNALTVKFQQRNGVITHLPGTEAMSLTDNAALTDIKFNINNNFINVINTLGFLLSIFGVLLIYRRKYFFNRNQLTVILVMASIVLLHFSIFLGFTKVHDFSSLKMGMLLILMIGFMLSMIDVFLVQFKWIRLLFTSLAIVFTIVKAKHGYDKFEDVNKLSTINPIYEQLGKEIRSFSKPDERVFANAFPSPVLNFYAKRNVQFDGDGNIAKEYAGREHKKAVFFHYDGGRCDYFLRVSELGDTLRQVITPNLE